MTNSSTPPEPAGGDAVDFLIGQHHMIHDLLAEVSESAGPVRQVAFQRLVRLLAVHETAEEQLIHPLAQVSVDGSRDLVAQRLAEEHEAKETLAELERMGPDAPEFEALFERFRRNVLAHAHHEEVDEFTALRASVPAQQLRALVGMLKIAEAVAPTHPHPGVESAVANYVAGPVLSLFDRTRDLARKALVSQEVSRT